MNKRQIQRQIAITSFWLNHFEGQLADSVVEVHDDEGPYAWIAATEVDALASQIDDLYEDLVDLQTKLRATTMN